MAKKLQRSRHDRVVAGVCGGLGECLGFDSTLVRVLWVFTFFLGGSGLIAYILAAVIVPEGDKSVDGSSHVGSGVGLSNSSAERRLSWIGAVLIILGAFFLLEDLFSWIELGKFWPLLFVVIGGIVLFRGIRSYWW